MHVFMILCVVVFAMLAAGFTASGARHPFAWAVLIFGGLFILFWVQGATHFLGGS